LVIQKALCLIQLILMNICFNLRFDLNKADQSYLQCEKHNKQRILKLHEITIDWNDKYEKAKDSDCFNYEFHSNGINENDIYHKTFDKRRFRSFVE
jgi:hypothetical protein